MFAGEFVTVEFDGSEVVVTPRESEADDIIRFTYFLRDGFPVYPGAANTRWDTPDECRELVRRMFTGYWGGCLG